MAAERPLLRFFVLARPGVLLPHKGLGVAQARAFGPVLKLGARLIFETTKPKYERKNERDNFFFFFPQQSRIY